MSDNEDEYDDLPSISVKSSARDSSVLSMPPAAELAWQRAREEETERELQLLRAEDEHEHEHRDKHEHREARTQAAMVLAHSDSSSSEGEASLAAAVTALQVQGAGGASGGGGAGGAWAAPDAVELLTALLARLNRQDDFLTHFLHAITDADPDAAAQLTEQVSDSIASAVLGGGAGWGGWGGWSEEDVVSVVAWLCCACVWRAPDARAADVRRARTRRTLHRLLGALQADASAAATLATLAALLAAALPVVARLHVSDAARTGAGVDTLADLLLTSVLIDLCTLEEGCADADADADAEAAAVSACVSRSWARLDASAQYLVLVAAGRALAGAAAGSLARRRLLAALPATAPPAALDRRHPDHLKVLVGASKLQLLFRADK